MLSPKAHAELMLIPQMHLSLLLSGHGEAEYARSVGGVLNIGIALANRGKHAEFQARLQEALLLLVNGRRRDPPFFFSAEEAGELKTTMNLLDRYIGVQHKSRLVEAMAFIEKAIDSGGGVDLKLHTFEAG